MSTRLREVGERSETDGSSPNLGLTDMGGRVYDPLAGRFTTADPIMQAPFWSQGQNRYAYVFNDPINATDPSGFSADGGGVAGGAFMAELGAGGLASGAIQHAALAGKSLNAGLAALGGAANVGQTLMLTPGGPAPGSTWQTPAPSAAPSSSQNRVNGMGNAPGQARPPGPTWSGGDGRAMGGNSAPGSGHLGDPSDAVLCKHASALFDCIDGGPARLRPSILPLVGQAVAGAGSAVWGFLFPALPGVSGGIDAFQVYRFTWAGGGRAAFSVNGTRILVDQIYRGTVARAGTGGAMLAKALGAAGVNKPTELFIPNVLQKTGESTAVLRQTLTNAAQAMGGTVQSVSQGIDAGKTWLKVTIGY